MAGSKTVKAATLVEEDEDNDDKISLVIVNGRAVSVRFGHNRDSASANSLSDPLTKMNGEIKFLHCNEPPCFHRSRVLFHICQIHMISMNSEFSISNLIIELLAAIKDSVSLLLYC